MSTSSVLLASRLPSRGASRQTGSSWSKIGLSTIFTSQPSRTISSQPLRRFGFVRGTDNFSCDRYTHRYSLRSLATSTNDDGKRKGGEEDTAKGGEEKRQSTDALRDAVNRLKHKDHADTEPPSSTGSDSGDVLRRAADLWDTFKTEVGSAWQELLKSGERKHINKQIVRPEATAEGEKEYTGPVDIMVIDPNEHLTAWERMQRRLTEAPIIQRVMAHTDEFMEKTGAKEVKKKLDHLSEDAREAWETSQNPWVYRASSVYDTLTAESTETAAVRELRKLDPAFTLEDWRRDVVELTLPQIMEWFLQGKVNQLKPWLGEGVFRRIASEIAARKQEGVQIDTHVLGIMNSEILAVEPDEVNRGSPIILLHFMCQQINCVRKKKTGEIVEGGEDDIRANSYVCAFQREYDEEAGSLNWKIVDFRFNGAIAYL